MLNQEWSIQSRSNRCAVSGRDFAEGEYFYTLLFDEKTGFRREDLCEEAYKARNDNIEPFSTWRMKYEPPPPPAPEPLGKQTAEDLLRQYMLEQSPQHASARYLLAAMLERKRILKEKETKNTESGVVRIYEHAKSGEVFVIPDPGLRLDQLEQVQNEVAELLSPGASQQAPRNPPAPPQNEPPSQGPDEPAPQG